MPLAIEKEQIREILFVTVKGEYSIESAESTLSDMLDELLKLQVKKALIDCRLIESITNEIMDLYSYSSLISKECNSRRICPKLAYLYSSGVDMALRKFGENVAFNRGVNGKVFTSFEKALEWLKNDH